MTTVTRRWTLVGYPAGLPDEATWRLEETTVPQPGPGEILVRAIYLSVDPYMRGRISPAKSYAPSVEPGGVMVGGGVGQVVESRHPGFAAGDLVESFHLGWQEHAALSGALARKLAPEERPLHAALSYLGLTGLTAWCGLFEVGRPRVGETVVVSAAAGGVGQVAGQLAKLAGCRAVAVASSEAKLAWCRELGYDATVNYRTTNDLAAAIALACPGGVDVFFDNTAGPIHDAVMASLAQNARVVVCGTVALAAKVGQPDIGPRWLRQILVARATVQGFLVFDHQASFPRARAELARLMREGRLRHREEIAEGIEAMPRAFLGLLHSENLGKRLVRVGELPKGVEA